MAQTVIYTTEDSATNERFQIVLVINRSNRNDDTRVKKARVGVSSVKSGDDGSVREESKWYRLSLTSQAGDQEANGSSKEKPLPATQGTAADMQATKDFVAFWLKQFRFDVTGDTEA